MVYSATELLKICLGLGEPNPLLPIKSLHSCGNKGISSFFPIEYFFTSGDFETMFVFFVSLGLSGGCLCFVCGVFTSAGINDNRGRSLYCSRALSTLLIGLVLRLLTLRVFVFLLLLEFRSPLLSPTTRLPFPEPLLDWLFFDIGFCYRMDSEIGVKNRLDLNLRSCIT